MTTRPELNFPNPIELTSDLYDRADQLNLIRGTVLSAGRRIVVIVGERVTGKTSLLNVVISWASTEPQLSVLQMPPVVSRGMFMEEVLDGMAAEAGTSLHQLGYRDVANRLTTSTVTEFVRVASDLTAKIGRTFVACLDELDSMLVNCPNDRSANEILDLIVHISNTNLPIKFVFTLTRATPQIMRADATSFLVAARIAELGPWNADQVREFVDMLLGMWRPCSREAYEEIYAAGGGHPYLTKAILHSLVGGSQRAAPEAPIVANEVQAAVAAALGTPEVQFTLDNVVQVHFSADELLAMQRAARSSTALPARELGPPEAVRELVRRYYLRPVGDSYVLAFGMLGRWLNRSRPVGPPAQRLAMADVPVAWRAGNVPMLIIDAKRRRAFLGVEEIQVTPQGYRFLDCVVRHAGSVVARDAVSAEVWPGEIAAVHPGGRLDQLVHRLRDGLGDHHSRYFEVRRGIGFYANPEHVQWIPEGRS